MGLSPTVSHSFPKAFPNDKVRVSGMPLGTGRIGRPGRPVRDGRATLAQMVPWQTATRTNVATAAQISRR